MLKKSTAAQIVKKVKEGLNAAWDLNRRFNDDPFAEVKPEYLTTVEVSRALIQDPGFGCVRMEEKTTHVANWLCLHPQAFKSISRSGNIDITVYDGYSYSGRPIVVIENKNLINGFSGIKKDVQRNMELLLLEEGDRSKSLALGICTFYWFEKRGVLTREMEKKAQASLANIEQKVHALVIDPRIGTSFEADCISDSSYASDEEACEELDEGQPMYQIQQASMLFAGLVVLKRKDRLLQDGYAT